MRALVVTIVHHPDDSRIRFREINALLDAGWNVTYAAPFSGYGISPPEQANLTTVDVPRASGRRRLGAIRGARALLKRLGPDHDVILLHDPELLAALPGLTLPPVVWDVHEDTAAAVTLKPWLPRLLRPLVSWTFARVERFAEKRVNLILAEYAYQRRFRDDHLVVPNVTRVPADVPPPDEPRVIYVGSMTAARGVAEMVEVGRQESKKTHGAVRVELVGPVSADMEPLVRAAAAEGVLDWPGMLPNDQAMARVDGSLAGLSLLRDEPNYRISMPTKVTDYIAHGVPVITTPLPLAKEVVDEVGCGVVVPFEDPTAAADAVVTLWADPERRRRMGADGHKAALERYDWTTHAEGFVTEMERIANLA
jgi:glycosyltransferase involved in cell wall biosynthesis